MGSLCVIDSETFKFRPAFQAPTIVCLTYAEGAKKGIFTDRSKIFEFLNYAFDRVLDDPENNMLGGAHIAFDMACFMANFPELEFAKKIFAVYEARAVLCTQIIEQLLDNADGVLGFSEYNLEALAKKYLDWDLDKENSWRLRYEELHGVPLREWPKAAVDYAVNDSVAAKLVLEKQFERAAALEYTLPDAPEQAKADFALVLASNWGIRTNEERVRELDERTGARMGELALLLQEHGLYSVHTPKRGKNTGIPQGKKSTKTLQGLVAEAFGGEPPRTATGRISTAKLTLEDVQDRIPQVGDWLEFQGLEKTASTYIRRMYDGVRWPLHPRFNVLVATGRNSSSNPNLHNQPRLPGVRECFEARRGYKYVSSDANSQEMRTWAQACETIVGWSRLAERYRADPDFDPHIVMAATSLLRIPEEEAIARLQAGDEEVEKARQSAKIANFGLPGMMGVNGLIAYARGYGQRWAQPEICQGCAMRGHPHGDCFASQVRRAWRETWPEAAYYFGHVKALPGVEHRSGRIIQLFSGRWRGGVGGTDAGNSYFQGLAADASKAALFEVSRRCYTVETSWLFGCRPVVLIHDEILMEAPEDYAHEAAMELVEVMEAEQNKYTPDVPARAGAAIMSFWSKKAKAKYDEGGRLVSWN